MFQTLDLNGLSMALENQTQALIAIQITPEKFLRNVERLKIA
jgi:hypothetical protein